MIAVKIFNKLAVIMTKGNMQVAVNQHVLYANWVSINSVKTGDSFTGVVTLAILSLATTGVVLLRKRK